MQKGLTQSKEWTNLKDYYEHKMKNVHMRDLFKDKDRFNKYSIRLDNIGILFDYSKNIIDDKTKQLLLDLVTASDLKSWTEKIFSGVKINWTEKRAVLHSALRNMSDKPVYVDGKDVMIDIKKVLNKMKDFTEQLRSGKWKGATGKEIKAVINIGIGGSDLGPRMVCEALKYYAEAVKNYEKSNSTEEIAENYKSAAELMIQFNSPNKAKLLLKKAMVNAVKTKNEDLISEINLLLASVSE